MIKDLVIKSTDKIQCAKEWYWDSDTNGWSGYHIWCVDGGAAQIEKAGERYCLFPGDIFIFDFRYRYLCKHDSKNPLKVTSVYFSGDLPSLQSDLFKQEKILYDVIHKAVECYTEGERELALMWLYPAVEEIVKGKRKKREICEKIQMAVRLLEEKKFRDFTLEEIAAEIGYSQNHFIRVFTQDMGITPLQYCIKRKVEQARSMLLYSNMTVSEIAYSLGYNDISYFTKVFKQNTKYSPSEYRDRNLNR